jgi:hypothetical protein
MKAQSNIPLPDKPQRWKDSQYIFYFNHKDNGIQEEEKEGQRYEANFTISSGNKKEDIETALIRSIADTDMDRCVVDNIEVEGKKAIEVKKTYKITAQMTTQINAIFVATPISIDPIEELPIEENPVDIIKPK